MFIRKPCVRYPSCLRLCWCKGTTSATSGAHLHRSVEHVCHGWSDQPPYLQTLSCMYATANVFEFKTIWRQWLPSMMKYHVHVLTKRTVCKQHAADSAKASIFQHSANVQARPLGRRASWSKHEIVRGFLSPSVALSLCTWLPFGRCASWTKVKITYIQ